jgi:hypothetical protein
VGIFEMHDIYVYFPAVLGLFFALLQVALKFYFKEDPSSDADTAASYAKTPVEMPYPVLGQVRQVVMLGSHLNTNNNHDYSQLRMFDHDLSLHMDDGGAASSKVDYVEMGGGAPSSFNHHHQHPKHKGSGSDYDNDDHQNEGIHTISFDHNIVANHPPSSATTTHSTVLMMGADGPMIPHPDPLAAAVRSRSASSGTGTHLSSTSGTAAHVYQ